MFLERQFEQHKADLVAGWQLWQLCKLLSSALHLLSRAAIISAQISPSSSSFAKLILLKALIWMLYLETSEQYDHMSCGIYQVFSVSTVVHVCKSRVQNKFNCFDLILARYVRVWMGCMISPGLAAPPGPHVPEGDMPRVGRLDKSHIWLQLWWDSPFYIAGW